MVLGWLEGRLMSHGALRLAGCLLCGIMRRAAHPSGCVRCGAGAAMRYQSLCYVGRWTEGESLLGVPPAGRVRAEGALEILSVVVKFLSWSNVCRGQMLERGWPLPY